MKKFLLASLVLTIIVLFRTPSVYAASPGTFDCGTLGGWLTCGVVNYACSPGTKPDETYCSNISNAGECDITLNIPCIPDTNLNTANCVILNGSCIFTDSSCKQGYKEPCSGRSISNCTQANVPCELSQSNTTDCAYNIIGNNACEPVDSDCLPGYKAVCTSCPAKGVDCVSSAPGPTIPVYDPTCGGNEKNKGGFEGVKTALGCLPTDPQAFVNTAIPWAIGIGAGIAFLLGIFGAMMIVLSAGNPEKLQAGKEMITSAIAGLLLIIFAIFLLSVIGVDLLGLFPNRTMN